MIVSLLLITVIFVSRLLPHPANISPLSAVLLFTPLLFSGKSKVLSFVPLIGLLLSDLFLGFHSTMLYVYGSYMLIVIIGWQGKTLQRSLTFFTLPLLSSLLFFTITNFGVWATTTMYSKDITGLLHCYWMGIPFLRNTILGDVFFFSVLFIMQRLPVRSQLSSLWHQVFHPVPDLY